jgi:hypothetical protein
MAGLGVLIAAFFASAAMSGQATHFGVTVSGAQTAGAAFTVTVRALDANENVDKSYKDNHNLTYVGPGNSPAPTSKAPDYPANPVVFNQGVATVSMTLYNAAATTLTVSESNTTITGQTSFTVNAGAPALLSFAALQPPVWVEKGSTFDAKVTVFDSWSNLVPNGSVEVRLNKKQSALTCPSDSAPCTATTDALGVAFFDDTLKVSQDAVGFTLNATAGSATTSSNSFNVGDQYHSFNNGNGPSGSDDPGTTQVSTIVNGSADNNLGITVDATIPIRIDLCGGGTQVGSGTVFEVVKSAPGDPKPTWTITGTVSKSALIDTSRGAASYEMCLGTRNLALAPGGGTDDCLPNASATSLSTSKSWPAKGGCAVPDSAGNYWGNMLDAGKPGTNTPANIKNCADARAPVVLSKNKTGSGNLVFKLCVPWPWDGGGGWR